MNFYGYGLYRDKPAEDPEVPPRLWLALTLLVVYIVGMLSVYINSQHREAPGGQRQIEGK